MDELDIFDPFKRVRRMEERMKRLLDDSPGGITMAGLREPLVDIVDKGNELQVIAELPGIDKKDVELELDKDGLTIKAKSELEKKDEQKEKGYYYHERRFQSFFRNIPLPVEVVADKASAEFRNGVLTINMPKKHSGEKPKRHKVSVK